MSTEGGARHGGHRRRHRATGGPGTGKTLVARDLHRRLEQAGHRPLYLCSTLALAAGLRGSGLEHAWTVGDFAARLLEQAKLPVQGGAAKSDWSAETWDMLPLRAAADALPALALPYDSRATREVRGPLSAGGIAARGRFRGIGGARRVDRGAPRRAGAERERVAGGQTNTSLGVADRIGAHAVVRADSPAAGERIISDTFLRFKGLERPFIIATEWAGRGRCRLDPSTTTTTFLPGLHCRPTSACPSSATA